MRGIDVTWIGRGLDRLRKLTGRRADAAAGLLGALSALALPPLYVLPALLIAFPGLIALIDGAPNWRGALRRGFWFGFCHHLIGVYWITSAILIEASQFWWFVPFAVPCTALILAPFAAGATLAAKCAAPGWRRALMLAAAWSLSDLARQFVATGFPWNPFGSVLALPGDAGSMLIAPAAVIGINGLTFFTVWFATLPGQSWRFIGFALAGLLVWVRIGTSLSHQPTLPAPDLKLVLIQADETEKQRQDYAGAVTGFERSLALTRAGIAAAGPHPTLVIWSEDGANPFPIEQYPPARAAITQAGAGAAGFLIGSVRYASSAPDSIYYNSMIALAPSGDEITHYDKWHLVPFGEYSPPLGLFGIKISPGNGFSAGPGPRTLHLPGIPPAGALICYEAVFSGQAVDESDRPAWLANITDDAWFGDSSGPRQHLAAVRLRAVEEGLPVMRAANTGITAGFDAHGRELGRIGLDRSGYLVLPLTGALPPTPFSRFGLWIPFLLAAFAAGLALIPIRRHDASK